MEYVFPKYIIENGCLIISKCTYHYQLLQDYADKSNCKGGGWWKCEHENEIILHGGSHDLGKASLEDVQACINSGKVFTDKHEIGNSFENYIFYYYTGTQLICLTPYKINKSKV